MNRILISGAAGFIGHHVLEHFLKNTDDELIVIDRLSYASSGFDRLKDIGAYGHDRVKVLTHDFTMPIEDGLADEIGKPDFIIHMGAETHVDRSIHDPLPFVRANVIGTMEMLEFAKKVRPQKFLYFSTDEIFGDAPDGVAYKEWDRYNSRNPYAASKAGGEELAMAYANSYGIPVIVTHCMNVFGERQHNEKFIPIVVNKVRMGEKLQIHCKDGRPASRSWIHARNVASAIDFLLQNTEKDVRDKFNIVGAELDNLDMAHLIAGIMKKELNYELIDHYSGRPGHDPRYMLDGMKMQRMGWVAPVDMEASLERTIRWSMDHPQWLNW